ncbi:hypothetical protein [Sphingopyxis sp. A083]|uniref:hypothetical protein n=1 Tax=Sphingopyxis sp. A083 TaxID=1759083 RepID=UPI0007361664|nr:hypothetical protein [Sphingopyxis sp. A083]KTE77784.1 hypothetical protein ATE59_06375 [Sphingopyxis sp. A083]
MNGILYIDETAVEATTGHMLVTFKSGGDALRFHLPAHVALRFRQSVMQDAWQVCCAPDAEVIELKRKRTRKPKAKSE